VMGYDLLRRSRLGAVRTVFCGSLGSGRAVLVRHVAFVYGTTCWVMAVSASLGLVPCGSFRYGGHGSVGYVEIRSVIVR